jgi:predicted DNA-binding protein with PD1-like motif
MDAWDGWPLGFFEPERKDYMRIAIEERVEALSLVGDITHEDTNRAYTRMS